jgi:hypothetical protein
MRYPFLWDSASRRWVIDTQRFDTKSGLSFEGRNVYEDWTFDISTLEDQTTVQCSQLKLLQLAAQIVYPTLPTVPLDFYWKRGYLDTTAVATLLILPRMDQKPLRILLRLRIDLTRRVFA